MATYNLKVDACTLHFKAQYIEDGDFNRKIARFVQQWNLPFTYGTGAGKINFAYQERITLALSGTATRDLRALTDELLRTAIVMTKVKALLARLVSSPDAAATLVIGAAGANPFSAFLADPTDKIVVPVSGWFGFATNGAGLVVDATHKNVLLTNSSATQSIIVDFVVAGEK